MEKQSPLVVRLPGIHRALEKIKEKNLSKPKKDVPEIPEVPELAAVPEVPEVAKLPEHPEVAELPAIPEVQLDYQCRTSPDVNPLWKFFVVKEIVPVLGAKKPTKLTMCLVCEATLTQTAGSTSVLINHLR